MKAAFSLLVLVATINLARAGSFAGPPPFTNGSPLQSGTDGTYQAVAEGVNLTGVFSFVIRGGLQTSDQSATINGWVFFLDGNILQGSVVAAISEDDVVGILNGVGTTATIPTDTNGTVTLPTAIIIPSTTANGEFSGSISLNNPLAVFEGTGTLRGTPQRTDQLLVIGPATTNNFTTTTSNSVFTNLPTEISSSTVTDTTTDPAAGTTSDSTTTTTNASFAALPITTTSATEPIAGANTNNSSSTLSPIIIPASAFPLTRFRFEGTRVSITPATPPAAPAAAAASPAPAA
jgi:hypothetical protein